MVILGSTGSIGKNSLLIAKEYKIKIEALACKSSYKVLNEQIREFKPKFVYIEDKELAKKVNHKRVFSGEDGLLKMLDECESETVINALVGFAGLKPSLHIQKLKKTLALANKESLVVGGKFLKCKKIQAIDSEHFGLKFLLNCPYKAKELIITASGGAFYNRKVKDLKNVSPEDALKHPNWDMGAKITIDSATMANKLFEMLEAYWLYDMKNISAYIERTSTIHALVNFVDGSTTAHLSKPDMKLAIAHAIFKGKVKKEIAESCNLLELAKIKFEEISYKKYPIFELAPELLKNPDLGVIINASNEIAVEKFLKGEAKFLDIAKNVFKAVDKFAALKSTSLEELFELDKKVRNFTKKQIKG